MLADQLRAGKAVDGRRIKVTDTAGQVLAVVPLRDVLRLPDMWPLCCDNPRWDRRGFRGPVEASKKLSSRASGDAVSLAHLKFQSHTISGTKAELC